MSAMTGTMTSCNNCPADLDAVAIDSDFDGISNVRYQYEYRGGSGVCSECEEAYCADCIHLQVDEGDAPALCILCSAGRAAEALTWDVVPG